MWGANMTCPSNLRRMQHDLRSLGWLHIKDLVTNVFTKPSIHSTQEFSLQYGSKSLTPAFILMFTCTRPGAVAVKEVSWHLSALPALLSRQQFMPKSKLKHGAQLCVKFYKQELAL